MRGSLLRENREVRESPGIEELGRENPAGKNLLVYWVALIPDTRRKYETRAQIPGGAGNFSLVTVNQNYQDQYQWAQGAQGAVALSLLLDLLFYHRDFQNYEGRGTGKILITRHL